MLQRYIVSPRGRTSNRTVTQMRHILSLLKDDHIVYGTPRITATSYCDTGRPANVVTLCLLTPCLNMPKNGYNGKGRADSQGMML